MGTNNKKKTIKDIKGLDKAHPYSRKATQMKRAVLRQISSAQKDVQRNEPKKRAVEKMLWFKEQIPQPNEVSVNEIHEMIEKYINRHFDEIQQLKSNLREGRPKPNRLDLLEGIRTQELKDYAVGFEIPDLSIPDNVAFLRHWNGQYGSINTIKVTRLKRPVDTDTRMA